MFALVKKFLAHVVPQVIKPLHSLWNQMIGFLFLAMAAMLIRPAFHSWRTLDGDFANLMKFLLIVFFFAVLFFFGVQAFWRARRITRS
jgi:thiol:disulfide interchange protein